MSDTDTTPQINPIVSGEDNAPRTVNRKPVFLIVLILVVVLVAGGVAAYFITRQTDGDVNTNLNAGNATLTSEGIAPATLNVQKGQAITWTNEDDRPHRLTADQEILPGFDTIEALNTGDTYTYIFDESGTFNYYDPDDPAAFVGTVMVE